MICPLRAPTHFSTAMLRIFCRMNTRVTLDTAMPPRMTMIEADEAQVVLGAIEVAPDLDRRSTRYERALMNSSLKSLAQRRDQRLDARRRAPARAARGARGCRTRAGPVDGTSS